MKIVKLPKKHLNEFISGLDVFGELHAPLRKGEQSFVFDKVTDPAKIELNYNRTILPPKKYFCKPVDPMFKFSAEKGYEAVNEESAKKYIILGVHPCDIHSLKILDLVFGGTYVDDYYFARRKNTAIIGIDCVPDDLCFCRSMGTDFAEDGFDLFLSDIDDAYLVRVGTSLGDDMVNAASSLFQDVNQQAREEYKKRSNERRKHFKVDVEIWDLPEIMDLEYESQVWQEVGDKCLSCGTCSMVCPTCYCYDVFDELNLDAQSGERKRRWDSCLFKDYALVAGGHNFRAERSSRVKNRYYHKERGFVAQYGRPACVGCGRCIAACPAGINIIDVITKLRSESYV